MAKTLNLIFLSVFASLYAHPTTNSDDFEHPQIGMTKNRVKRELPSLQFQPPTIEKDPDFWNNKAENILKKQLNKNRLNKKMAKNVIYFLGDGLGISTLMPTRMYKGGEELELSFEKFPYAGLSKTYCANTQGESLHDSVLYLSERRFHSR